MQNIKQDISYFLRSLSSVRRARAEPQTEALIAVMVSLPTQEDQS